MVEEERVVTRRNYPSYPTTGVEHHVVTERAIVPSGPDILARLVLLIFGVIQALLILRIIGMLIDASRSNDLVRLIYDVSAILVAPFEGIIRTEAVESGASVLDVTAIVALIGWTLLEFLILAAIGLFRRQPA
jgi:YGGT family